MINVEFDEIFCEDLKDDFEEAGRNERNFTISDFVQNDYSRAFGLGFCYKDLIEQRMWIPVSIRKEMRHISDNLEDYNSQLEWLNSKYGIGKCVKIKEYVNYILNNIFCDDKEILLRIAIVLGMNLRNSRINEKT